MILAGHRWKLLVAVVLVASTSSCRKKAASVEDLFTIRTLGLGYLQRGQLREAEVQFSKLTELAPDDPLGYANLGLAYLQEARYPDAEPPLKRARKLDPGNVDVGLMLARLYALTGREADARTLLGQMRTDAHGDARVLYALAKLDAQSRDPAAAARYEQDLREVLGAAPTNLAVRLELAQLRLKRGAADSVVKALEEVRRIPPEPPKEASAYLDSTVQLLRANDVTRAAPVFDRMLHTMQVTVPYQASYDAVKWTDAPIAGEPVLSFTAKDLISVRGLREKATVDSVRFTDVTDVSGLPPGARGGAASPVALAVGDIDNDGSDELFVANAAGAHLYRVQGGFVRDISQRAGITMPVGAAFATFADYDNDGWLDLFVIGGDGRGHLYRNGGSGTFADVTAKAGIADLHGARKAVFVDIDHDGDLDLVLFGGAPLTVYRNNLDGTFTDVTTALGLSGIGDTRDVAFGDFDGDGRTDLFVARQSGGDLLLRNGGTAQRFVDVTRASGITSAEPSSAAVVGDFANGGFLDIAVASAASGAMTLWRNKGDGTFTRDTRSTAALKAPSGASAAAMLAVDYDNDGWVDLLVAASGKPGLFLFRNDGGRFVDRSNLLPAGVRAAGGTALAASDVDNDGDLDLFVAGADGSPHLVRNDGGNANLSVKVQLRALRNGSGKNNDFGIGARLELRAGDIYQTRVVTTPVTYFGLGPHLKADVLRIEWTNGVPQAVYFPGTDRDVLESEVLKGSCGFVYTWDGRQFRFMTDAMWRSALGMPLGLMGSTSAFAPAGASQEYVKIPGEALQPRDGRYVIQLTEELWETAYADEVKLVAVDHPDSVDVFVDERFVPPGPVKLRLYQVGQRHSPLTAVDERGRDVLPALLHNDDVYVSNLTPLQYQGAVEPHEIVMDLGPDAGTAGSYLFLRGWIYPTDASINVALSQQSALKLAPPALEVRDAQGRWMRVADIGFPSGKNKTIVVGLAGKFPTRDHHVRVRTNMQIYWDEAFVAHEAPQSPVKSTTLAPVSADLHFRGFSRTYRKGGRYGPYWFDYSDVTKESPWRPITGAFTRFGDVLPLLQRGDDEYVIMAAGDEATIQFDAGSARTLPPGWKRDFLLYTDGWIKDSDLNTAYGTTVEPLPFHAIRTYPYSPGEHYPADAGHERYRREYLTRLVTRYLSRR